MTDLSMLLDAFSVTLRHSKMYVVYDSFSMSSSSSRRGTCVDCSYGILTVKLAWHVYHKFRLLFKRANLISRLAIQALSPVIYFPRFNRWIFT